MNGRSRQDREPRSRRRARRRGIGVNWQTIVYLLGSWVLVASILLIAIAIAIALALGMLLGRSAIGRAVQRTLPPPSLDTLPRTEHDFPVDAWMTVYLAGP